MHVSQRSGWGDHPRRARRATPDWTVGYLHTLFLAMASLCYADLLSQADAQIAIHQASCPPGDALRWEQAFCIHRQAD